MDESTRVTVEFGDPRLPARFWAKVQIADNGCWHWTGWITESGYPQIQVNRKSTRAHRWVYNICVAPLLAKPGEPGHLQVDHMCHNEDESCSGGKRCLHRRCVNPNHLRAVTQKVNVLAGKTFAARNAAATHCIQGHEYTPENTYLWRGGRHCKKCNYDRCKTRHQPRDYGPLAGTYQAASGRWRAAFRYKNRQYHLGTFDTREEAVTAIQVKRESLRG